MERLTGHLGKYVHIRACSSVYLNQERKTAPASNVVVRLTAIEDILGDEYDLDRLRDMIKAQDEGRVVVLPCKVGETLYTESPVKGMITSFEAPDLVWIIENISEFGKTVFLNRAEAEAALGGGGDE